jgi:type IV pilus assembly protein PilX
MVMTLLGVTAMQGTTQNERMSSNAVQMSKAFEAAEAGLRAAETYLASGAVLPAFDNSTPGLRTRVDPTTIDPIPDVVA